MSVFYPRLPHQLHPSGGAQSGEEAFTWICAASTGLRWVLHFTSKYELGPTPSDNHGLDFTPHVRMWREISEGSCGCYEQAASDSAPALALLIGVRTAQCGPSNIRLPHLDGVAGDISTCGQLCMLRVAFLIGEERCPRNPSCFRRD